MKVSLFYKASMFFVIVYFLSISLGFSEAFAQCDAKNRPVGVDVRQTLANKHFETVAIWVGEKQ